MMAANLGQELLQLLNLPFRETILKVMSLQKLCLQSSKEEYLTLEQFLEMLCSWVCTGRCVIFMSCDQLLSVLLGKGEREHKHGKRCSMTYLFVQPKM